MWNATQGVAAADGSYDGLAAAFVRYHTNEVNVFLHLLTTPVGLVGVVSLLRNLTASTSIAAYFVLLYLLSLSGMGLTAGVYIGTALACALIVYMTRALKLSVVTSLAIIVVAYALQDLAHMGTGEATFQSTYSDNSGHVSVSWHPLVLPLLLLVLTPPCPTTTPTPHHRST